jgi:hypothetical protein
MDIGYGLQERENFEWHSEESKHVKIHLNNLQNYEKYYEHSHTGILSKIKLRNNFNASL